MNSPTVLHPNNEAHLIASREDLAHARQTLRRTLAYVHDHAQPWPASDLAKASEDPYVIGRFGDLKIRIDVAQALLERAESSHETPLAGELAAIEASIAGADAVLAAGNLQQELTGFRDAQPNAKARLDQPLRWNYQVLGNYRLNGVLPPLLQESADAP